MPSTPAVRQQLNDPFLLPICTCGSAACLAAIEPDLLHPLEDELRTYRCTECGSVSALLVHRQR